jgi:hypothetical protein
MGRSSKNRKRKNWFKLPSLLPKKVELVYVFWSPEELWKYKVGLSNSPSLRMGQVGKKVVWWAFIPLPCFNALRVETVIHNVLKPLNTPVDDKGGSGGTEWFLTFNVLTFVALLFWYRDITMIGIIAAVLPYPIDGVIVVLLAWILDTGLILSAIGVVAYILILIYGN